MADIKCPHCGKQVAAGSKFCNYCGHRLIAASDDAWQDDDARRAAADDYDDDDEELEAPHKKRNMAIIIAVAAFIALVVVRYAFFDGSDESTILDTTTVTTTDESDRNTLDIFNRALDANGQKNDGDKIAYAMRLTDEQGKPANQIVGLTYRSDDEMTFFRIYTLTKNGSSWDVERKVERYFSGRKLVFDPSELGSSEIPLFDNVNGKSYFYFAYADMPRTAADTVGRVVTSYFDITQGEITATVTYRGEVVRASSGQKQVVARNTTGDTGGILGPRLQEHAQHIGYLHIPTPEELAAEQAERQREAEEKLKAEQEAARLASGAVDEDAFAAGDEVPVATEEVDKTTPLFKADEFKKKITAPGYTVFLLKDGRVVAFNKQSDKNFVVHFGGGTATDIGWEDSATGLLNVRTTTGKVQCNLGSHTVRKLE